MSQTNAGRDRLSRRHWIQGACAFGGLVGTNLIPADCGSPSALGSTGDKQDSYQGLRPIWRLDRPKPPLPQSYFWTWDHSTNWMLDDPGMLNFGCSNRYLKQPRTFVADYQRLIDLAAGLGVKGIVIWGFLRDAHGGVESAKQLAEYAASQEVAILPGLGTNHYGGVYYEGDHPYNLETFLKKHPDAAMVDVRGQRQPRSVCPSHPRFADWIQQAAGWLFKEFAVGGANLENGDFLVCYCPRCRQREKDRPPTEPAFWHHQYLGYSAVLQALTGYLPTKLVTWATYKGFLPGGVDRRTDLGASMGCERPALVNKLPPQALAQWTLTGMVRSRPLPLTTYLDQGTPPEALSSEFWPAKLMPPTACSVGFLHQGSQWSSIPRYEQIVSTIKEGCLRAYRAGLQGVSIHGEVSSMHIPWALNYLAFSHFIHWPEDSLRAFGVKTLGAVFGSRAEGEAFAELLAHWDAGTLSDRQKADLQQRSRSLLNEVSSGRHLVRWRFWNWLACQASGYRERQTVSFL